MKVGESLEPIIGQLRILLRKSQKFGRHFGRFTKKVLEESQIENITKHQRCHRREAPSEIPELNSTCPPKDVPRHNLGLSKDVPRTVQGAQEQEQEQEHSKKEKNPQEGVQGEPKPKGIPQRTTSAEESFAPFWKLYPRKTDRKPSLSAWSRLTKSDRILALDNLPRHIAWWKENGTKPSHIPHASTWLNARRWEDQLPTGNGNLPGQGWEEVDRIIQERQQARTRGEMP